MSYNGTDILDVLSYADKYNGFQLERVLAYCEKDAAILDFGAGTGTFIKMLRAAGYEASFVETDPALCRQLEEQGFAGYCTLDEIEDESLDFIYSLNVLEHIEDDEAVLQTLFSKLKKGGVIYLYLPALTCLYSSLDRKVGHYRRYSLGSLEPKILRAGFTLLHWEYIDFLGIPITLIFKMLGNKKGNFGKKRIMFYDKLVFPVSRILDKVFHRLAGKNIELVLQK